MPHLLIQYKDLTLFDGEVDELSMADTASGISVAGKITKQPPAGGLLELLGAARRRKDEQTPAEAEETA